LAEKILHPRFSFASEQRLGNQAKPKAGATQATPSIRRRQKKRDQPKLARFAASSIREIQNFAPAY
jgi:hypothetical protein